MADDTITVQAERQVQIETYQVEDAEWPGDEVDKEAYLALAEKIGAKKQVDLVNDEGAIPFQRMSDAVKHTWKAFCPGQHRLAEFSDSMIPMRVMKLLDHCIEKKYFGHIEIWTESETNPDPVAVGYMGNDARYLLARWGEALLSWPEVVKKAREKWIAKRTNECNAKAAECQSRIDKIENDADTYFGGGYVSEYI
jgi:hypothetical protein